MKTRLIRTLTISAYLSAMLTSSVLHVRGNVILARAIDPTVARQVVQSAVSGLSAEGWAATATMATTVAVPTAVMSSIPEQAAEPVISEELMARLIKRAMASEKNAEITAAECAIFGLCDGTRNMPTKRIVAAMPDGKHYFELPIKEGSEDIIIALKRDDVIQTYLTDKNGKLRAAATSGRDGSGLRLITNEQAAEKFKIELQYLAKLAEKLPPTGTAGAAGKS